MPIMVCLYRYTIRASDDKFHGKEMIDVYNHTECHCQSYASQSIKDAILMKIFKSIQVTK